MSLYFIGLNWIMDLLQNPFQCPRDYPILISLQLDLGTMEEGTTETQVSSGQVP